MNTQAATTHDIGIFIALKDEFRDFQAVTEAMGASLKPLANVSSIEHFYSVERIVNEKTYRCVVAYAGDMAEPRASRVTERMISAYHPSIIVVLGIAGAIDSDLRLCDVVVGDSAESYLHAAKAGDVKPDRLSTLLIRLGWIASPEASNFTLAGDSYRTSALLKVAIDNLEFSRKPEFLRWRAECATDLNTELSNASLQADPAKINKEPIAKCGPIASGPVVVTARTFVAFLKKHNRKFSAVEMETGGVLGASNEQNKPPHTVVIRGISDLCVLKHASDQDGGGLYRRVAMRNATRLFWTAVDTGVMDAALNRVEREEAESGHAELSSGESEYIAECTRHPDDVQVDSISRLIAVLKDNFKFEWEPASYKGFNPIVFWPIRLRRPTPIHAVQTFAASAIRKYGGQVILCLDDLGNQDYTTAAFFSCIRRWRLSVGMNDSFVEREFKQVLSRDLNQFDAWPIVNKWLGETDKRLLEVLRITKIIKAEENDDIQVSTLKDRRPRRLLNPAVVWTCLKQIMQEYPDRPVITLGGFDERPLWEAWRTSIVEGNVNVGHLYIPNLGSTPIHMSSQSARLEWNSRSDIEASLRSEITRAGETWRESGQMVEWYLNGCVTLPDFVKSNCTRVVRNTLRPNANAERLLSSLSRALDSRLLQHDTNLNHT